MRLARDGSAGVLTIPSLTLGLLGAQAVVWSVVIYATPSAYLNAPATAAGASLPSPPGWG